ncbi:MAG TPA: hypothetical protein VG457_09970, partial [Planctomycetota bacterium]|nr:hypothetical protein [Planctomycetota bacterium]
QVAPSAKLFCEEYADRIKKGEAAEFNEIEARKRIFRLKEFMATQKYPQARSELDILHVHFWKTNEVQSQQQQLQDWEKRISKEGGESFNTAMKSDRFRAIQQKLQDEQAAARKVRDDVVLRLGRLDEPFEKGYHLGSVYAAAGDFKASSDRYGDARKAGETMIQQGRASKEFLPLLGSVFGEIYRNAILLKNKKDADAIRNQGSQRFTNPDTKAEEDWWTQLAASLASWSETIFPQEERKLAILREQVRLNPEDPAKIWALAQTCSDGVFNLPEARGYYAWLLENHPEFPQVQNGTCQYKLAEIHWAAREVREAIRDYQILATMHRDHPRVSDGGVAGVKRRLDECYKLNIKMGYSGAKIK